MTHNDSTPKATAATPQERAKQVVALTVHAWNVAPESPQAHAQRAHHGYVPQRVMRRLRSAANALTTPSKAASPSISYAW